MPCLRSGRAGRTDRAETGNGDALTGIEELLDLAVGCSKDRSSIGDVEQGLSFRSETRVVARSQRRSPSGRPLGGDETLARVWVPTGEGRGDVVTCDRSR